MAPGSNAQRRQRRSAGILLYRSAAGGLEVLLVHPGGPFWARRDAGVWSIPKGEYEDDEEPLIAARREFAEELGTEAPAGQPVDLGEVRQKSGKYVRAWALEGDLVATAITSNTFALEWPPRSGRTQEFPEVDRAQWFSLRDAREKLNPGQVPLLDRLVGAQTHGDPGAQTHRDRGARTHRDRGARTDGLPGVQTDDQDRDPRRR